MAVKVKEMLIDKSYFKNLDFDLIKQELNNKGYDISDIPNTEDYLYLPNSQKISNFLVFKV